MGGRLAGGLYKLRENLLSDLPYPLGHIASIAPEYAVGIITGQGLIGSGISAVASRAGQKYGGELARDMFGRNPVVKQWAANIRDSGNKRLADIMPTDPAYQNALALSRITGRDVAETIGSTAGGIVGISALPVMTGIASSIFSQPEKSNVSYGQSNLNEEQVKKAQQRALEQAALNQYYAESLANYPV